MPAFVWKIGLLLPARRASEDPAARTNILKIRLFNFLLTTRVSLAGLYMYADKVWTVQGYESRKDFWFLSLKRHYCNQQRLNRVIH